jgi:replicative DNA helicase
MTHPELPYSIEDEQATLGAILMNREAILAVAPWLQPDDFYLASHGDIYRAALGCLRDRVPPDVRTISTRLRDAGQLEAVGGVVYLAELLDACPTAHHIAYYARPVEQHATRRRLIAAGGQIAALGYDTTRELDDLLTEAQAILTAAIRRPGTTRAAQLSDALNRTYDALSRGVRPGIPSGLRDLDELTGGLHPGALTVFGGRPGTGKSSLLACIATCVAKAGRPALLFSLEMTIDELAHRFLAMESGVNLLSIRQYRLGDRDLEAAMSAMGRLAPQPIWIDDSGTLTLNDIRSRSLQFVSERGPIGLLAVDYLQLVSTPIQRGENRASAVGAVSRGLKALAKELACPVIALSQLSRAVEGRAGNVPLLSDLRESGDIEADADVVAFIYREELYDKGSDKKGVAELHIAKHRGGPLGVVMLRFDAATTRFQDLTYREAPAETGSSWGWGDDAREVA